MANTSTTTLPKGFKMEELLRNYFLKAGYFVIRGVPFIYEGFDVTDIDLWLYGRSSSVSREITIVDSKNKKTPQAIERIFWTKGLKIATSATNAIVATTDKRQEVKNFGKELDIVVLDGNFLQKLQLAETNNNRISDEEFEAKINEYSLSKLDGDWKGRIKLSKGLLSKSLSFNSCNEWLNQGNFFAEQSITKQNQKEIALRCLYLICSFIAIAIDYNMKEISFYETSARSKLLKEGFTYGSKGRLGIKNILDLAVGLIKDNTKDSGIVAHQVRTNVERKLSELNTSILSDYFSKQEVAKGLFAVAKEFEQLAMDKTFVGHSTASVELRSLLFCLLDFWNINRKDF